MPSFLLESCSESIRRLAAELAELESQLGHPDTPPDIETRVIEVAHQLRNELQVQRFTQLLGESLPLETLDSANSR